MFLPGAMLLELGLFGSAGPVNAWLEKNVSLSYQPVVPFWAAQVMLALPPLLALLYFLKLKRKALQVPSTFLWRKSIEDLHVNSLFQWLRNNVLLLLQVLAVLVLIYALMAWQLHGRSGVARHYILMIDNSASMAATDVAPSRLEQAKQEALAEIEAHGDADSGMVLVFNSAAEIRQSFTSDRNLLRRAVQDVEPTHRPTRIGEALTLADSLANPQRSTDDQASRPAGEVPGKGRTYVAAEGIPTEVHLFSDGRFADVADFALGNLALQYHRIGETTVDNIGVVTLNAVRDPKDPGTLQVLATLHNHRDKAADVKLQLEVVVNGGVQRLYDRVVKLPARTVEAPEEGGESRTVPGEASASFTVPELDDRSSAVLHARLADHRDQFPDDDEAWLVVGVLRKARVLIVGNPNKPLHDFFDQEATRKVANVTHLEPKDLKDDKAYVQPAHDGAFDLVVFDRCAPATEKELPLANTFFIGTLPPPWPMADTRPVENVRVLGGLTKHPLMQYLGGLQDIRVGEAFRFNLKGPTVPPRTPRLLEADQDTALLFTLGRQSFTDLVMAFPLITDQDEWNTNWVKQVSFPLFLRNVLYILGNVGDAAGEETVQAGQVKTLRPETAVARLTVVDPRDRRETLRRGGRADFLFGKTEALGVYRVQGEGTEERRFAVNLLDAEESNLTPRERFRIGGTTIAPGQVKSQPRDLWKWVALLALGIVLLEWVVYNRRIFI
jgi:hypothetical protein